MLTPRSHNVQPRSIPSIDQGTVKLPRFVIFPGTPFMKTILIAYVRATVSKSFNILFFAKISLKNLT